MSYFASVNHTIRNCFPEWQISGLIISQGLLYAWLALQIAPLRAFTGEEERRVIDDIVQEIVRPIMDSGKAVGMVVGIVSEKGKQVYGYGRVSQKSAKVPDGETIFEIGSISKVFTALLLADMAQKKIVSLDDPIRIHLPDSVKVPEKTRAVFQTIYSRLRPNPVRQPGAKIMGRILMKQAIGSPRKAVPVFE